MSDKKKVQEMIDTLKNSRREKGEEIRMLNERKAVLQAEISLEGDFIDDLRELSST